MSDYSSSNRLLIRNTAFLYGRTFLIMLITLYSSRVILNALGVEDYGTYNAVAGLVSMFGILTASLSTAISRYLTYELGRNDANIDKLKKIFSISLEIQSLFSLVILILGETIGLWFVNTKLNIPAERLYAANWVWQGALLSFVFSLIKVPHHAVMIAHEHMNSYAIFSVLYSVLKLLICFLIIWGPFDRLAFYAVLHTFVDFLLLMMYVIYCKRHFTECHYHHSKDRDLTHNMFGFAGFSFMNNSANILNLQGVNILINIFFGVALNAARSIATQVEGAIMQLVENVTFSINPQITKSYAAEDKSRMFSLVCKGTKYSYYLMLLFAVPVFLEAEFILAIWLKTVPVFTVIFLRLTLIGALCKMLGNTGYTACMATGNIKKYSIWITAVGILVFPITWIAYKMGAPVEYAYYAFIVIYILVEVVRLILMKEMLDFPPMMFVKEVVVKIFTVTPVVVLLPSILFYYMSPGWLRLIVIVVVATISSGLGIYYLGLSKYEREYFTGIVKSKFCGR